MLLAVCPMSDYAPLPWAVLQDGQKKPGQKGLNMNRDQWQRLVSGMPGLDAALTSS